MEIFSLGGGNTSGCQPLVQTIYQGGLCIAVSHIWAPHVIMSGSLSNKRAQYIVFQIGEIKWGLLNLYAPNSEAARTRFWSGILSKIPQQIDHWALVGDFNMIEDVQDRQDGSLRTICGSELRAWERLCVWLTFGQFPPSIDYRNPHLFQDLIDAWRGSTFLVWTGFMGMFLCGVEVVN